MEDERESAGVDVGGEALFVRARASACERAER